jgi:hypothetical protein
LRAVLVTILKLLLFFLYIESTFCSVLYIPAAYSALCLLLYCSCALRLLTAYTKSIRIHRRPMSKRRTRRDELDFEIHVDDTAHTSDPMDDGSEPFIVSSEIEESGLAPAPLAPGRVVDIHVDQDEEQLNEDDEQHAEEGDDDAVPEIMESIEGDEPASRRGSAMSSASFTSDRRRSSRRQSSNYAQSQRDSYGGASGGRPSTEGSEKIGGGGSAGDSSSHHENEDDVFSDDSPRSSMGSVPEGQQQQQQQQHKAEESYSRRTTSTRISDIQAYEVQDDFVPAVRETPRPTFRSPSTVWAAQMHSPPGSVVGCSNRSKRGTPRQSNSRMGSPNVSTQLSPKKTPTRFKRHTPPLVLLHVTLLPLRWPWGDLLDNVRPTQLSEAGKGLREAWRQLQDRFGDTVSDRGVLLPHPQSDFEVLEERLLEAMELPLRRRARILECGHYLGPANEMSLGEDAESYDDDKEYDENRPAEMEKKHWCSTCQCEIRYDTLGEGKVFRTKVYASNGLMKAGAWDACWKEMERVDAEVEPIIDPSVLDELERIANEQEREAIEAEMAASNHMEEPATQQRYSEGHNTRLSASAAASADDPAFDTTPVYNERRTTDEERLREIYGDSEPSHVDEEVPATKEGPRTEDFLAQETPPSPTVEAMERRESRRQAYKSASLPELVMAAVKVLFQDRKNAVIGVMGLLVMMLAVRGGEQPAQHGVIKDTVETGDGATYSTDYVAFGTEPGADPCAACTMALESVKASCAAATATVTVTETYMPTATADAESVDYAEDYAEDHARDHAEDHVEEMV